MIKRIMFKNTEHSDQLENYANEQLAKVEEFLSKEQQPVSIDLVIEPSKSREHHKIELLVKSPQYDRVIKQEHNGIPCYESVAQVIDIMYRELHNDKERRVEQRKELGRHEEFKKQR